jgi:hypothetical protein
MTNRSAPAEAYRKRAFELRAEAETISNVYQRNALLEEANNFDQLARLLDKEAEERQQRKNPN